MILKSYKTIFIFALCNILFLNILLFIWADKFELFFDESLIFFQELIIIFLSVLWVLIIKFSYKNKKKINKIDCYKLIIFIILFGFLYYNYCNKIYSNLFQNRSLRNSTSSKLIKKHGLAYGSSAYNLNYDEYTLISTRQSLTIIEKEATKISYEYGYDGFLPDFYIKLRYHLPINIKVKEVNYKKNEYDLTRIVEKYETEQIIRFEENQR